VTVGTSLQFSSSAINGSTSVSSKKKKFHLTFFFLTPGVQGFACQMLTGGMPSSITLPIDQCVVPPGINGPVAIWVTSDMQPLNGDAVQRQSNAIVAGPTMAFIDVQSDAMGSLVTNVGSSLPPPSFTQTVALNSSSTMMNSSTSTPPPSSSSSNSTGSGVVVVGFSSVAISSASAAPAASSTSSTY
jgi:hypothetical protein